MTTLRQIITATYRELAVLGVGRRAPNPAETVDALAAFNAMWKSMQGRVIGQRLTRQWSATAGVAAIEGGLYAAAVSTPAQPHNGARIGMIGAHTVTAADGTIEGLASVTKAGSWFYREDLADWLLETDKGLDDSQPFAPELDEALAFMLAARLLGQFGKPLTPLIQEGSARGQAQLRQLYGAKPVVRVDHILLRGVGNLHHYGRR